MTNKKAARAPLSEQERAQRRQREQQLVQDAVAQLRSSIGWQRWLTVRARVGLRRYSVRNQLLIALQDPTATSVAGFRAWLKLGYCVRHGQSSHIQVWAPCPPSKKQLQAWHDAGANPDERPRTYFRLEAVFTAEQVDPLPPPAQPAPLDPPVAELHGDSLAWAQPALSRLAVELGYSVAYRELRQGHGGSCDPASKAITINSTVAVNEQVSVFCHELAHALVRIDRQDSDPSLDYAQEELVAESVAHIAVSFAGLDSTAAAVPYLASWSEAAAPDAFERIAVLVDRLARRVEDALGANDTAADTTLEKTARRGTLKP